ncbi:MAG: CIA30 family protein, partial [Gammaproteobacteria bacterium]
MPSLGAPSDTEGTRPESHLVTDFKVESPDLGWYVVNDNVMGGRSEGGFELEPGGLHFSGRTNTNGGGFSSIRTAPMQLDLSPYAAIRLRVRGDGRRYTWRLTTDARHAGRPVAYWAEFDTTADAWHTVDVPFTDFVPRFRGSELDGPPLDTSAITGMGLMIYDKRDGPFEIRLASFRAVLDSPSFSLDRFQWQKRLLVVSASRTNDSQLREQREGVSATREAFRERDMLLVTLLNDAASSAGDQALTGDEIAAARE